MAHGPAPTTSQGKKTTSAKTQPRAKGVPAKTKPGPLFYFEPSTHSVLVATADNDVHAMLAEAQLLDHLIEDLLKANAALATAQEKCRNSAIGRLPDVTAKGSAENTYITAQQEVNKAYSALQKQVLDSLGPMEKGDATKITELLPLWGKPKGGKMTYVRSSKVKDYTHPYPLSKVDAKSGGDSFITKEGRIDSKKLNEQLKKLEPVIKYDLYKSADKSGILTDWAERWNRTLKTDPHTYLNGRVSFEAGAQFLRWTHGASVGINIDPTRHVRIKAEGHADLALAEGKSTLRMTVPDKRGWMLSLPPQEGKNADLGLVRVELTLFLSAAAGASISAEAGIDAQWGRGLAQKYGIRGTAAKRNLPPPSTPRRFLLASMPNVETKVIEVNAFVGVQATAGIKADFLWCNPEAKNRYDCIASCSPAVTGLAGAGGGLALTITFINGKFRFNAKAGLCWGYGAKGNLGLEVDANILENFAIWVVHQLKNVDYKKLVLMMPPETFFSLVGLQFLAIAAGVKIGYKIGNKKYESSEEIRQDIRNFHNIWELAKQIIAHPELLKYILPEAKGLLLGHLLPSLKHALHVSMHDDELKERQQAVQTVLNWTQAQNELRNVMQYLTPVLGDHNKQDWQANKLKVNAFLAQKGGKAMPIPPAPPKRPTIQQADVDQIYARLHPVASIGYPIYQNDTWDYRLAQGESPLFRAGEEDDDSMTG